MASITFPREAVLQNLAYGEVVVRFVLAPDGRISQVRAVRATHEIFAEAAMNAVRRYQCRGLDKDTDVQVSFIFRIE